MTRNPFADPPDKLHTIVPTILLNKPYKVLCQFRDPNNRKTLGDYINVPKVYPAGRLDFDSEGLLVLTSDGRLQARISEPKNKLVKAYWTQVEGLADAEHCAALLHGVSLKDGSAKALGAKIIGEPPHLWKRDPPIRERKHVPTSWLEISIDEGRNRQIRRMAAAAGLPVLRLIRCAVGPWQLGKLQPGASIDMTNEDAWQLLKH